MRIGLPLFLFTLLFASGCLEKVKDTATDLGQAVQDVGAGAVADPTADAVERSGEIAAPVAGAYGTAVVMGTGLLATFLRLRRRYKELEDLRHASGRVVHAIEAVKNDAAFGGSGVVDFKSDTTRIKLKNLMGTAGTDLVDKIKSESK